MFGDRLKILRIDKGLSQQDIGEIVGKSQQAVAVWEKGLYEPDNESLIRLADYFNVSTDYLLGLVEEKRLYAQITTEIDIDNPDLESVTRQNMGKIARLSISRK